MTSSGKVQDERRWGSDLLADVLLRTGVPYVALNPGVSFRGLHDSLVNHSGEGVPRLLMCLHEEHAVAVAHGFAKVAGQPLAVALHSNVGLMHAAMAVYNAWCDRVPVLLLGGAGPLDAARRRPWIDWVHTSIDQAALVRGYVKWDDQPASVESAVQAVAQAWDVCRTPPCGPTYVVLDTSVQEAEVIEPVALPRVSRDPVVDLPDASPDSLRRAVAVLLAAERPVVLVGRVSRDEADWRRRIELVEFLGARVVTDLKVGAAFPTTHPAHVPGAAFFPGSAALEVLAAADAVLALEWVDPTGTLSRAPSATRPLVSVSIDAQLHNGWSKDGQARVDADVHLPTTADRAVEQLLSLLRESDPRAPGRTGDDRLVLTPSPATASASSPSTALPTTSSERSAVAETLTVNDLSLTLQRVLAGRPVCLVRLPLGWDSDTWPFEHPLDYLGYDGGAGIGSGPGMLVGAALALRGDDRLPVAVLGDGDYLMGVQALWTAAHERIPLLAIVANNRTYYNDEVHQQGVAALRGRDESRRWIGARLDDPAPDLAGLARAQGLVGIGPVTSLAELTDALTQAVQLAGSGQSVVVDVLVVSGYSPAMAAGMSTAK
jgi:thiamine pyrophosphate-dependent acetolactate synthase large subunit-like protein